MVFGAGMVTAQQIEPVGPGSVNITTEDGFKFRAGLSLDFQPTFTSNLDFNEDTNFRTITEFGAIGEDSDTGFLGTEDRLFFSIAKGRVSLYSALELDGVLDERSIDNNNPNIERINLALDLPEVSSSFHVGADIYVLDGIGGLTYIDDDPGIWFKGGTGNLSWQLAVHKRIEAGGAAGDSAGRFASRAGVDEDRDDDTTFFSGKVGVDHGPFHFEPFFLVQKRDTPNFGTGLNRLQPTGPGGAMRGADPLQADITESGAGGANGIPPNQLSAFLGIGGTADFGVLKPRGEFVYHKGEVSGLTNDLGQRPFGFDEFDIQSWAAYFRLDFDVSTKSWWPLNGAIPFVEAQWNSGDDDPFDDDLEGFVSPSNPSALRPTELMFLRKTIAGLGMPVVGDGDADFGGMEVTGRGIGPTIGNILEGATFGGSALFNNRFGKGDNPGFIAVKAGVQGAYNERLTLGLRGTYFRFDDTEPIEAEFRSFGLTDVDEEIGFGFDALAIYKITPQMQLRPFVSVLFPGDGAEQLAGDDQAAVIGGLGFFSAF